MKFPELWEMALSEMSHGGVLNTARLAVPMADTVVGDTAML
jgi:hypothetical protein